MLDVKIGSGAFMPAREDAEELARTLVRGRRAAPGWRPSRSLTDMDQVLGTTAGNAVEVRESIDYLTGAPAEPRLHEVTMALAARAARGSAAHGRGRRAPRPRRRWRSGAAAERFARDGRRARRPGRPARDARSAPRRRSRARPPRRPRGSSRTAAAVGLVVTGLGGNRGREDDVIDHSVGLTEIAPVGAQVGPDRPLAVVHAASESAADAAVQALRAAVRIGDETPEDRPVIAGRID